MKKTNNKKQTNKQKKNSIYLVSSKSLLYEFVFGSNINKGLTFYHLYNQYLKPFLPKETLLATTVLLLSILFIEIKLLR